MINFKFVRFTLVAYISHKVNLLVTYIILNISTRVYLIFTSLHIGSRLFELFSKEVRVKKQPRMPLSSARLKKSQLSLLVYTEYEMTKLVYYSDLDKCQSEDFDWQNTNRTD